METIETEDFYRRIFNRSING